MGAKRIKEMCFFFLYLFKIIKNLLKHKHHLKGTSDQICWVYYLHVNFAAIPTKVAFDTVFSLLYLSFCA